MIRLDLIHTATIQYLKICYNKKRYDSVRKSTVRRLRTPPNLLWYDTIWFLTIPLNQIWIESHCIIKQRSDIWRYHWICYDTIWFTMKWFSIWQHHRICYDTILCDLIHKSVHYSIFDDDTECALIQYNSARFIKQRFVIWWHHWIRYYAIRFTWERFNNSWNRKNMI